MAVVTAFGDFDADDDDDESKEDLKLYGPRPESEKFDKHGSGGDSERYRGDHYKHNNKQAERERGDQFWRSEKVFDGDAFHGAAPKRSRTVPNEQKPNPRPFAGDANEPSPSTDNNVRFDFPGLDHPIVKSLVGMSKKVIKNVEEVK